MTTASARAVSATTGGGAVNFGGWLFDAREFDTFAKPTAADLDAIVAGLTATSRACTARGFPYVPAMVPAKRNTIGPAPSGDRTWVAELNGLLRDVDEVEIVNLQPVLRHASRHGPCYHRTDTDWNARGAFFLARALLKEAHKMVPALRPAALADLHLRGASAYRGALLDAERLELREGELVSCHAAVESEDGVSIDASWLRARRMPVDSDLSNGASRVRVYANPKRATDTRVAVVGDAAALPVTVWIAEQTGRTALFSSKAPPLAQLELERPQVVIHLVREMDLLAGPPSPVKIA